LLQPPAGDFVRFDGVSERGKEREERGACGGLIGRVLMAVTACGVSGGESNGRRAVSVIRERRERKGEMMELTGGV
jgi:hypothetical protein